MRASSLTYVCQYQRGRRFNIGRSGILTPAQARDKAREILGDATKGIDPNTERQKKNQQITLKQFVEQEYFPWVKGHRKSGELTTARIQRCFFKEFSHKPLSQLTTIVIEKWRSRRLNNGTKPQSMSIHLMGQKNLHQIHSAIRLPHNKIRIIALPVFQRFYAPRPP